MHFLVQPLNVAAAVARLNPFSPSPLLPQEPKEQIMGGGW